LHATKSELRKTWKYVTVSNTPHNAFITTRRVSAEQLARSSPLAKATGRSSQRAQVIVSQARSENSDTQ
jgi:hypothetical protein